MDLKTLPGMGYPASVSLEEVIRIVELRLPCQILGQHQSRHPAWPLSCWGRSLGHSIGHLTAQMATQCIRLLAWTWSRPVVLFHSIGSGQSSRLCCTQASSVGLLGCLTVSGSQGLGCAGLPHWITGYLAGHHLTLGLPSFTGGLICKGVEWLERQKFEVSTSLAMMLV